MPHRASRRRFLKGTAVAVAGLATRAIWSPPLRAQTLSSESVIVVGAGLAGLAAAQRLRASGRRVTVLEARATPGGRVRTIRGSFDNGLYGEAGAARISETHTFVLDRANELGLILAPFTSSTGAALFVLQGKRYRVGSSKELQGAPLDLHPHERGLTPSALLKHYIGDALADLSEPDPDAAHYARWKSYDRQTWPAWLHARGASEDAVGLMTLGSDPKELSALYLLRQIALHRGSRRYHTIRGGMDLLPQGIAAGLGDSIKYNVAVVGIDHGPVNVSVSYNENGRTGTMTADRLVLAVPFSVLRHIDIRSPFADDKMRAIEALPYYPATRFLFQTPERSWQAAGLSGAARTDYAVETWDDSAEQSGARGIVSATVGGRMDEALGPLDSNARVRAGRKMLSQAFPDAEATIERTVTLRWGEQPWARGAFAAFRPGQLTDLMPVIARPEGRVHFAGEHTSPWTGWMEGALRSGERVAQEILQQ
jgi:monoamine oxidase